MKKNHNTAKVALNLHISTRRFPNTIFLWLWAVGGFSFDHDPVRTLPFAFSLLVWCKTWRQMSGCGVSLKCVPHPSLTAQSLHITSLPLALFSLSFCLEPLLHCSCVHPPLYLWCSRPSGAKCVTKKKKKNEREKRSERRKEKKYFKQCWCHWLASADNPVFGSECCAGRGEAVVPAPMRINKQPAKQNPSKATDDSFSPNSKTNTFLIGLNLIDFSN